MAEARRPSVGPRSLSRARQLTQTERGEGTLAIARATHAGAARHSPDLLEATKRVTEGTRSAPPPSCPGNRRIRKDLRNDSGRTPMDSETMLALLGAFGIGTMFTTVVQHLLTARSHAEDRSYLELRECFAGLLQSIAELDRVAGLGERKSVDDDVRAESSFNYWVARVELVASDDVVAPVRRWRDSTDENRTLEEVLGVMRKQLGVAKL